MKLISQLVVGFTLAALQARHTAAAEPPVPYELTKVSVVSDYFDKVKALVADHVCGYKVVSTTKTWESAKYKPDYFFSISKTAIQGDQTWFSKGLAKGPTGDTEQTAVFLNCESAYRLGKDFNSSAYKLTNQYIDWIDPKNYASRFHGFSAISSQIYQFSNIKPTDLSGVTDTNFEGIPAIKFDLKRNGASAQTVYIDRKTYQFLYSEMLRSPNQDTMQIGDSKQISRTTYRTVGGKRLPERHDTYYETPAGVKQPIQETVFTEYIQYTATADELDLEKQFGVKPIPHEPRPESAVVKPQQPRESAAATWLYAAGAAALLVALALGFFLYRRTHPAD